MEKRYLQNIYRSGNQIDNVAYTDWELVKNFTHQNYRIC